MEVMGNPSKASRHLLSALAGIEALEPDPGRVPA